MEKENFIIKNRLGLHARAAAKLVQAASLFESDVIVEKDGAEVNGKSIMSVLMLAAPKGSKIVVKVNGVDEKEALAVLRILINDGFGEE